MMMQGAVSSLSHKYSSDFVMSVITGLLIIKVNVKSKVYFFYFNAHSWQIACSTKVKTFMIVELQIIDLEIYSNKVSQRAGRPSTVARWLHLSSFYYRSAARAPVRCWRTAGADLPAQIKHQKIKLLSDGGKAPFRMNCCSTG